MPLSITVIAGLLGGLVALPMALWTPANMVLGVVITGWLAKLFTLGMAFLSIYVGIALQRSAPKGASIHMSCRLRAVMLSGRESVTRFEQQDRIPAHLSSFSQANRVLRGKGPGRGIFMLPSFFPL